MFNAHAVARVKFYDIPRPFGRIAVPRKTEQKTGAPNAYISDLHHNKDKSAHRYGDKWMGPWLNTTPLYPIGNVSPSLKIVTHAPSKQVNSVRPAALQISKPVIIDRAQRPAHIFSAKFPEVSEKNPYIS